MDFFEAQARARQRTSRLIGLFGLAVIGTALAGYFAAILILGQISPRTAQLEADYWSYQQTANWTDTAAATRWWDPGLFVGIFFGTSIVVAVAALFKWHQFSAGGSAVAESVGGRPIDSQTIDAAERRLLNIVEEMAIASGTAVPTVYLLPDETGINAFAAGLTTSDAVVAVTRGAVQKLTRDELQGVVGHEFSHILNGDMRMNLRIAAIVFGILVLGLAGRGILWSLRGMRSRGKGSGGVVAGVLLAGIALLIVGYVGYFFGRLIQAAVSRQREFLADAAAVQFTRNPAGISGALKKIGGFALGSSLQSHRSTAIGHFFFAQAFRSGLTGWWSTHPPLAERIRAIDPGFDGRMYEPPETVNVAQESFVSAGLAGPARAAPAPFAQPPPVPSVRLPVAGLFASNHLTAAQLANAQTLLQSTPPLIRASARTPAGASVLIYGLLLDQDPLIRAQQQALVARLAGTEAATRLERLQPEFSTLGPEHKLPLLQLALPAIKTLNPEAMATFLGVLDELVHADQRVSVFEFALQKVTAHTLELNRTPTSAGSQIHSFTAVATQISAVLSALAHAAGSTPGDARSAFDRGAAQLRVADPALNFLAPEACDFAALERALDRLACTSGGIRQRILIAAGEVAAQDGVMRVTEYELLRAFAAALDCPLPPLATIVD